MSNSILSPSFSSLFSQKKLYDANNDHSKEKNSWIIPSSHAAIESLAYLTALNMKIEKSLKQNIKPISSDDFSWRGERRNYIQAFIEPMCWFFMRKNQTIKKQENESTEEYLSRQCAARTAEILNCASYLLNGISYSDFQLWNFKPIKIPVIPPNFQTLNIGKISNVLTRIQQFQMQTSSGIIAQKYWDISTEELSNFIAKIVASGSIEKLFFSSIITFPWIEKVFPNDKYEKYASQKQILYPALFTSLGLVRALLERSLTTQRNSFTEDSFNLNENLKDYFSNIHLREGFVSPGYFHPERMKNSSCYLQESLQNHENPKGFSSEFHKLIEKKTSLEKELGSYHYQLELNMDSSSELEKISIFSSSNLSQKDFERIQEFSIKHDLFTGHLFVKTESNGDKYVMSKSANFGYETYQKFFLPNDNSDYLLGKNYFSDTSITCHHCATFHKMWHLLQNKFELAATTIKNKSSFEECIQKIGEFVYLYINIMPYRGGSAAIGEWLMRGLAKARGLDLGDFNDDPQALSWDFSAFIEISAEEYGKNFKTFFKQITPLSQ